MGIDHQYDDGFILCVLHDENKFYGYFGCMRKCCGLILFVWIVSIFKVEPPRDFLEGNLLPGVA
jgi:hypothetical protein